MKVTAIEVLLPESRTRRGRVCLRSDGNFQFVTETWRPEYGYWRSDYPSSGIFGRLDDAKTALRGELGAQTEFTPIEPIEFDLEVGPYPDFVVKRAAQD